MRFAAMLALGLVALAPAQARASCIVGVAERTTSALGSIPAGALVVAAPLETDVALAAQGGHDRASELAVRVAALVAGKIAGASVHPRVASLDDARSIAARASRLVYVRAQIEKSQLRVTVDAYPTVRNVWDRARLPPPPASAHAYAVEPIDAEVRAFFPPIPLVLGKVTKATGADADVVAAACGDLDGDGAPEILLVGRQRIALARLRAGKLDVARTVAWSALAKRAPVPLREPLGGAEIDVGGALVGSSDRGAVALDANLASPRPLAGGLPVGAGLCAPISTSRLGFEPIRACDAPPASRHGTEAFDAVAAFHLGSPMGKDVLVTATTSGGKLSLRIGDVEKATFDDAGAQVALLDADLDGAPEVAFSSNATAPASDSLTIATIGDHGPRVLGKIAAPAGVRALAACPPMDGGAGAIVAVVGSEVWLVR